jgi:hypothetical protein
LVMYQSGVSIFVRLPHLALALNAHQSLAGLLAQGSLAAQCTCFEK